MQRAPDSLSSTNWDVGPWRQVRKCAKIYRGFDVSVKELISLESMYMEVNFFSMT